MAIITIGIDLAKNVFAVHRVDKTGKPVLVRPSFRQARSVYIGSLAEIWFFAALKNN